MPQESFHGAWEWLPSHVRQRFCNQTLQDSALAASTPISAKVDLGLRMLWECAHHGSVPHITASRVLDKPWYAVLAAHASDSGRERIKAVGTGHPSEVMALK